MGFTAKHQEEVSQKATKPFKGLKIGIYCRKDVTDTVLPTILQVPDITKILIIIRNNDTNRDIFNGTLQAFYRVLRKGDRDLRNILSSVPTEFGKPISDDELIIDRSLDLGCTYHGNYEVIVKMVDSVPAGSQANTYLRCDFDYSDEPQTHEAVWIQHTLEKDLYVELGTGVEEIVAINTLYPEGNGDYFKDLDNVTITSNESSENYTGISLMVQTMSFQEDSHSQNSSELIIHDGEILTNCYADIKLLSGAGSGWRLFVRRMHSAPNAQASQRYFANKELQTLAKIGNY